LRIPAVPIAQSKQGKYVMQAQQTSVDPAGPWQPLRVERNRDDLLLTGNEYRQSLRDGRRVIGPDGTEIADVTTNAQLAPGIDRIAEYYDAHFAPDSRDLLTYRDPESGQMASTAWKVPLTVDDLTSRRELNRFVTYRLMGTFGRPPDYAALNPLGLLSMAPEFAAMDPAWAENVERYVRWGRANCVVEADIVADVQSDRRIPIADKPGRLRIVSERSDGIVVYGSKPCNSVCAQGHVGTILTLLTPQANLDAALFGAIAMNAPGLTMVCREAMSSSMDEEDHPLDSRGEEIDAFMIFENVFIPHEQLFCYKRLDLLNLYHEIGALCLWHIMVRMAHKGELLAGTAQVIANVLGTSGIPQVRDAICEVVEYATTLTAYAIAAEQTASLRAGVMIPNERFVTAGRLYSVVNYPRVLQLLRDLSGQGLISRFTKAQFEREDLAARLEEFVPGTGCTAREKNRLFNFVWDLTSGNNANRVAAFEHVNATPPGAMRNRIYESQYRKPWTTYIENLVGLPGGSLGAR
jgi:4-hydroxyphenylacetate 3-monooxygenase